MKNPDVIVLGSGIVGINAAITLKQNDPELDVLVVDRGTYPIGASTRNAGFACFGSVTEILDDLESNSEKNVFSLLHERLHGLDFLRSRVVDDNMDYLPCGGYEVFDNDQDLSVFDEKLVFLNKKILELTGLPDTFIRTENPSNFKGLADSVIFNQYEGCVHPGKMMSSFLEQASQLGVRFVRGMKVVKIEEDEDHIVLSSEDLSLKAGRLIVCTNGFTNMILGNEEKESAKRISPALQLKPVRNQVLVTEEIEDLDLNSCYHYDKGYVYFRNIGKRMLIGGGRNIGGSIEETAEFGTTSKVRSYLMNILTSKIGIKDDIKIDFEWSGILGVGSVKSPILKKHSEHIIFAVRLGGMGVALGSRLGDQAAKLLLNNIKN